MPLREIGTSTGLDGTGRPAVGSVGGTDDGDRDGMGDGRDIGRCFALPSRGPLAKSPDGARERDCPLPPGWPGGQKYAAVFADLQIFPRGFLFYALFLVYIKIIPRLFLDETVYQVFHLGLA